MIEITHITNGEKAEELSNRMIGLINEYSDCLNGFEIIGIIDAVKQETHDSIKRLDKDE